MNKHQKYELEWWGKCTNTFSEEVKQITYAHLMGLINTPDLETGRWPQFDLNGKSVLDIGGGPTSLLLKTINAGDMAIVDPCTYPDWVKARYNSLNIVLYEELGETFFINKFFDEVWIYNVLQHVEDPSKIINTAKKHSNILRIFEWINIPPTLGHPHMLTKKNLDKWIGASGSTGFINENSAYGEAYWGEFKI